ncbi:hypothetical protein IC575_005495 [Cucumis melo]
MSNVSYSDATRSLMYLMVCTIPDLAYSSSLVSRYMGNPGRNHWEATKWVFRYIVGTVNRGLLYTAHDEPKVLLKGYVNVDFAGDCDKRRSLTGFSFIFGGNLISWRFNLQSMVALSTIKSEFIAVSEAVKETI